MPSHETVQPAKFLSACAASTSPLIKEKWRERVPKIQCGKLPSLPMCKKTRLFVCLLQSAVALILIDLDRWCNDKARRYYPINRIFLSDTRVPFTLECKTDTWRLKALFLRYHFECRTNRESIACVATHVFTVGKEWRTCLRPLVFYYTCKKVVLLNC